MVVRDIVQFATMLVLVRLLSPEDYGNAALAQSIIGLVSVLSFGTFVLHALQLRDPDSIDWQVHFTAAALINSVLFLVTLGIAAGMWCSERYQSAAMPLAGLATLLLVEIAATLRHRMLETRHEWGRFRSLLILGTVLGSIAGLAVAALGGGVWALVVQVPLLGFPAAVDLFWHERWRPNWTWSWSRYRDIAKFGVGRAGATAAFQGRLTAEQAMLATTYDFAALGIFTRSIGLATLIAGRIGSIAMASLYPVITRAEHRTERFQRIAGLVLQGVCWTTVPSAVFLALAARDVVSILYGPNWIAVVPLLPLAAAWVSIAGVSSTLSNLLLANGEPRESLTIDIASAGIAVGLAFWLLPHGIDIYLMALVGQATGTLALALFVLIAKRGLASRSCIPAFLPPIVASTGAAIAVEGIRLLQLWEGSPALRALAEFVVFSVVCLALFRFVFTKELKLLLSVIPGTWVEKLLFPSNKVLPDTRS